MTRELLIRITVRDPPAGVDWAMQLGRSDLLPPRKHSEALEFEVPLQIVRRDDGQLDFRGPAVQGPRNGRFVYLNSGARAGQTTSCWDRRAKISLETLRALLADKSVDLGAAVAAASIDGLARDGGPACASVPLSAPGWRILSRT